jgi:hypothetical protein
MTVKASGMHSWRPTAISTEVSSEGIREFLPERLFQQKSQKINRTPISEIDY